jgi:hypothetical protein
MAMAALVGPTKGMTSTVENPTPVAPAIARKGGWYSQWDRSYENDVAAEDTISSLVFPAPPSRRLRIFQHTGFEGRRRTP